MVDTLENEFSTDGKANYFSPIDVYVGKFIASMSSEENPDVQLAASLVSRHLRDGHVCLNLKAYAGQPLADSGNADRMINCPELSKWIESLKKDENVGLPGEFKPLILDGHNRLYFHRYWQYERDIIHFILKRLPLAPATEIDKANLQQKLRFYFPETTHHDNYLPAIAACAAFLRKFIVITGSPGTGKTTTITRILAFLADNGRQNTRIALCAPTGKAAQRLEESVRRTIMATDWPERVKDSIPREATTVHRLLGSIRFSPYFRYDENNPLPYDIVVVDESSMVDLPLMAKLMKAISKDTQLILLGDKDQLASVEAGAVLGSICFPVPLNNFSDEFYERISVLYGKKEGGGDKLTGVHDCIIELKQNYRFHKDSGLGIFSQAVKEGESDRIADILKNQEFSDVRGRDLSRTKKTVSEMIEKFRESYQAYFDAVASIPNNPVHIFEMFEKFRILCALRTGIWGVEKINGALEKSFTEKDLIDPDSGNYQGRPVMVTQNDYHMNLFNGDIGIMLRDETEGNRLKVYFRYETKGMKKIPVERMPSHETVWAMTVHKSQGSEFDQVALVLSDTDNPLLTRELIYTGMTRARKAVEIWSAPDILRKAIKNQIIRHSGLTDALR